MRRIQPMIKSILLVFLFIFLTSCTTHRDFQGIMKNVEQTENDFAAGYIDGCDSGFSVSGDPDRTYFKDVLRYQTDRDYQKGWQAGYFKCGK